MLLFLVLSLEKKKKKGRNAKKFENPWLIVLTLGSRKKTDDICQIILIILR
jgi:hypothetical protein